MERPDCAMTSKNAWFILVDGHAFAYRCYFGSRGSFRGPNPVHLFAFLFVDQLRSTLHRLHKDLYLQGHRPAMIEPCIVWDAPGAKQTRRAIWPKYKADRKTPDQARDLVHALTTDFLGFHPRYALQVKQFEADDVIASVVLSFAHVAHFVVVSRDRDLFQLLPWCDAYDPHEHVYWTAARFRAQYGFEAGLLPLYKSVVGDSDNWPGVQGVGKKTMMEWLLSDEQTLRARLEPHAATVNLGRRLVTLPYEGLDQRLAAGRFAQSLADRRPPDWGAYCDRHRFEALEPSQFWPWLI